MRYCPFCQNVCEDDAVSCSVCGNNLVPQDSPGASSSAASSQPIWVTQKTDQPLDALLKEDDLWDDSGPDSSSSLQNDHPHSHNDDPDVDIFDEIAESTSLLFSNMSPKLKKFLLIMLITTLLLAIPFIYTSCTKQTNPVDSLSQIFSPTT